ncbi:MAG: 50S ribosomal protein L5 [Planctomycetaceae bacterium]|nr:50S ribosomal protein L5 [Planctomycetaceae bacterium]
MTRLLKHYKEQVVPNLKQQLGEENVHALPKVDKVIINMGVGAAVADRKKLDEAVDHLTLLSGQKPQITRAKKAIAAFRLREGMPIGCRVTLRGQRMYEFLDRLITLALPRVRDFRGVNPKSFDGNGNYSLGLNEQFVFPEISADKATLTQGMNITIVTSASSNDEGRALLKEIGIPFRNK